MGTCVPQASICSLGLASTQLLMSSRNLLTDQFESKGIIVWSQVFQHNFWLTRRISVLPPKEQLN